MSITILGMKDVSGLQRRERGSGGGMVGRMRVREEKGLVGSQLEGCVGSENECDLRKFLVFKFKGCAFRRSVPV